MAMQEDYGNLGNLISFLNGNDSLEDRLEMASKLFFAPLSLPPQHKEEVVILWIENILSTNKILTYTIEERELCWKTMKKLLTSQRLQALCSHNWLCSLATFFQTLVDTVSESTTPLSIKKEAFFIGEHFLKIPHLSPQASYLATESVSLCRSFLMAINPSDLNPEYCSFISLLIQKVSFIFKHNLEPPETILNIYNILLPLLKIASHLHADPNNIKGQSVLNEINFFLNNLVCHKDFAEIYAEILSFPFSHDTYALTNEGITFFAFIANCMTESSHDEGIYPLKPYLYCFFHNYNSNSKTCYKMFICLMNLLGVSLEEGPKIDSKVFISYMDKINQFPKDTTHLYILFIIQTLCNSNISLETSLENCTINNFIRKVGFYLLDEVLTEHSIKCLSIIGKCSKFFTKAPNLFHSLLTCCKKEPGTCKALDNLLCEICDTYKIARSPHNLYAKLCMEILALAPEDITDKIYFEPWTTSEAKHLLPRNFVKKLVVNLGRMGPQFWFQLADKMTKILSDQCLKILKEKDYTAHVSSVLWLTSICLSAAPITDIAIMSGMSSQVFATMNTFAQEGLLPLVSELIKINEGVSFIASALVDVILVWSELHMSLLLADIGYKEKTLFAVRPIFNCTSSRDFSAQAPFLNSEMWNKFLTTCFNDDIFGVSIIQLLIQKITLIALDSSNCKLMDSKANLSTSKASIQACLDDIFALYKNVPAARFTDVIADHLPSLTPFLSQSHWTTVAEMFISGFEEDHLVWKELAQSTFFKECNQMHFSIYFQLCQQIFLLLSQKKRKHNEKELNKTKPKDNYTNLARMVLQHALKLHDHPCEDNLKQCFISLNALLNCQDLNPTILLTKRSKTVILCLDIIKLYPLGCLSQNLSLGLISYLLVVLIGVGGINGPPAVVLQLLQILNLVVSSPSTANMFLYFKVQPYRIFLWFLEQSEELIKNSIEDEHLKIIIDEEEPDAQSLTRSQSLVEQLISLMMTWITLFIDSSKDEHYVLEFINELAKRKVDEANMKEENIVFALIISSHIRKKIMKSFKISPTLISILQALYHWSLMITQDVNFADITIVTLAFCLTIFESLLLAAATTKSKKLIHVKKRREQGLLPSDTPQNDPFENVEWKSLTSYGIQLIPVVANTANPCLKKLCFNFASSVTDLSPAIETISHLKMALSLISSEDNPSASPTFRTVLSNIPLKGYKKLIALLLQDLQSSSLKTQILLQWRAILNTPPQPHLVIAKGQAINQLVSILCIHITCLTETTDDTTLNLVVSLIDSTLNPKNCTLSIHSKSLIINIIPKVLSHIQLAPIRQFAKVFECCTNIFQNLLNNEYSWMHKQPSAILSTFSTLTCALMDRANESKHTLSKEDLQALEKISEHLHAITFCLRSFDTHLTKVVPFTIATIVHKIHLSEAPRAVKDSVEQIVYFLLDISDEKSLRHVMFHFPHSITALIKNYYSTYETNFKFTSQAT